MLRANIKAELVALSTLCNSKSKTRQGKLFSRLRPEFFGTDATRELFDRIKYISDETADVPSFRALRRDHNLSDAAKALLKKDDVINSSDMEATLIQLKDSYRMRVCADVNEKLAKTITSSRTLPVDEMEKLFEEALMSIRNPDGASDDLLHGSTGDDKAFKMLGGILSGKSMKNRLKTGWATFDTRTGGFNRGDLVVITANFGGGKSVGALTLFRNMHNFGYKVALASMEMEQEELLERMASSISKVEYNKIRLNKLSQDEKQRVNDAFTEFNDKNDKRWTYYAPSNEVTIRDIFRTLSPYGYDVIFIDYIGLLKQIAQVKNAREDQMLGEAARYCKIMAHKLNCVVVLLAQLNDEGKVFSSRAITHHANVWFKWTCSEEDKTRGYVTVEQGKSRGAECYDFALSTDFAHMAMDDMDPTNVKLRKPDEEDPKRRSKHDYKSIKQTKPEAKSVKLGLLDD